MHSVAGTSIFEHEFAFEPEQGAELLRAVPAGCGVVALYGEAGDRPYLMKAASLRRRLQRLLLPDIGQTKRLNLRDRVRRVAWRATGSEFASMLVLYRASVDAFGRDEASRRLKLRTPYLLRYAVENRFPRIYVTNRLGRKGLESSYGPFPSRASAERYCDAVLDLFLVRRCYEELHPYPEHPGCVYGEMKKCMAPCQERVSDETYAAEAGRLKAFLDTHGTSLLDEVARERDKASAEMEFEQAADAHTRWVKVKAAAGIADELVRPISMLRAVIVQPCTENEVELFLAARGVMAGPVRFSTLGIRSAKEQSTVGSSLFAQPLMLQAIPLETTEVVEGAGSPSVVTQSPEERLEAAIAVLEAQAILPAEAGEISDALALLRRWYYRPEKQRSGRLMVLDGEWKVRRLLRMAAGVAAGVVVAEGGE